MSWIFQSAAKELDQDYPEKIRGLQTINFTCQVITLSSIYCGTEVSSEKVYWCIRQIEVYDKSGNKDMTYTSHWYDFAETTLDIFDVWMHFKENVVIFIILRII